jgi:hypothetical protein
MLTLLLVIWLSIKGIDMATPNVGADPINPAYYAGTACAEVIEHMPTNVGFATKYAWRFGEKDNGSQESKKAIWYLSREVVRPWTKPNFNFKYTRYAYDRLEAACKAGKIDLWRGEVISELIEFTDKPQMRHLERAMILFEHYGVSDENN